MLVTIFDGYVDEPSILGVPPYISPYVREVAGVCEEKGIKYEYVTIDDFRNGRSVKGDVLVIIGGAVVPGKYLRTYPASIHEILKIARYFKGLKILGGGLAKYGMLDCKAFDFCAKRDVDALLYDILTDNFDGHRYHSIQEWNRWLLLGAKIVKLHPDFPNLIAEIETFRGCPRYINGGCSFCIEPLYGKPTFREIDDIAKEVKELSSLGVKNFRIGGQSCIYSYLAYGVGEKDVVEPNVSAIKELFEKLSQIDHKVLHVDNANPAVIAAYPDKARKITEIIVKHTTPGNVVAFGMESADPVVIKKNNLNATPEDVMNAIKIVNEIGVERGYNGMPKLLPGLNFLCGLHGESKDTYRMNLRFLKDVMDKGYLLRRINIREVASIRSKFRLKYKHECWKFRKEVRENVDKKMLKMILPKGSILRDVYLELNKGNYTFGRQFGSYPLIAVLPYKKETGKFVDVKVVGYGERSITAVEYPLNINSASYNSLISLPGVGKKKAAEIVKKRPFKEINEVKKIADEIVDYITL